MSTLVINQNRTELRKTGLLLLPASLLVLVFGIIYEHFSHNVFSGYMMFAWVILLAGGAVPCLLAARLIRKEVPLTLSRQLYLSGIAALTVGSLFRGVLDIYGTTNHLLIFYPVLGFGLAGAGIAFYLLHDRFLYRTLGTGHITE